MWPGHGIVQLNNTTLDCQAYFGNLRHGENDETLEATVARGARLL
jgi:hypothetical protein